jgi:hypothetical protein
MNTALMIAAGIVLAVVILNLLPLLIGILFVMFGSILYLIGCTGKWLLITYNKLVKGGN